MLRLKSNVFLSSETEESMKDESQIFAEDGEIVPENKNNYLNSRGIVLINGEFDFDFGVQIYSQFESAVQSALRMNRDYVQLNIDSNGGQLMVLNSVISAMQTFKPNNDFKYVGVVMGSCYSSAFNLLQHCDWRVGLRSSMFKFHFGSSALGNRSLAAIAHDPDWFIKYMAPLSTNVLKPVITRSGQDIELLTKFAVLETTFTAEMALEYNFIDEVVDCVPKVSKKVPFLLDT